MFRTINARYLRNVAALVFTAGLTACGTLSTITCENDARLYNLSSGEVIAIHLTTTDNGRATLASVAPTRVGENFTGESTTMDNSTYISGRSAGTAVGNNGALGSSTGISSATVTQGYRTGSAILVGDKGTTIDAQYRVNGCHAEGDGVDNHGVKYRLQR